MFGVRSSTGNDPEAPSSCRCRAVVLPDGSLRAVRWRRVSASAVSEIPARPTSRGQTVGTLGGEEHVTRQRVQSSSEGVFLCENYAYVAAAINARSSRLRATRLTPHIIPEKVSASGGMFHESTTRSSILSLYRLTFDARHSVSRSVVACRWLFVDGRLTEKFQVDDQAWERPRRVLRVAAMMIITATPTVTISPMAMGAGSAARPWRPTPGAHNNSGFAGTAQPSHRGGQLPIRVRSSLCTSTCPMSIMDEKNALSRSSTSPSISPAGTRIPFWACGRSPARSDSET